MSSASNAGRRGSVDDATSRWAAFAIRAEGIPGSVIDSSTSLLQNQTHDIVRMAMGSPSSDVVPNEEFAAIAHELFAGAQADLYDYGPTEGDSELRNALMDFLAKANGVAPRAEQLLITSGGMQGLDLACKLFIDDGDIVAVEAPTYPNGTAVITSYGGVLLEVPTDEEGLDVAALEELARKTPARMIYVIPNFQNPSGVTMSLRRRQELIALAERWGSVILEDDPYRQLRFRGEDVPSLQQLAAGSVRVVSVQTFSKILAPGLRVGWVTADEETVGRMVHAKQGVDTCTNVPMQRLTARFIQRGLLEAHIEDLKVAYRERLAQMQHGLTCHFADLDASWTEPEGGFFLWLSLPPEVDTEALFPFAIAAGVAFIPGSAFSASGRFSNVLRLAYTATSGARTDLGLMRLRGALSRWQAQLSDVNT